MSLARSGIRIGADVRINAHTHILAYSAIDIADKNLIAPFVLITSGNHGMPTDDSAIADCSHRPSWAHCHWSWVLMPRQHHWRRFLVPQTTVACKCRGHKISSSLQREYHSRVSS